MDWQSIATGISQWAGILRDLGLIIGTPVIIAIVLRLYNAQIDALKARNELLQDTQYDKARDIIRAQKELMELERQQLEGEIQNLKGSLTNKQTETKELQIKLQEVNQTIAALTKSIEVINKPTPSVASLDFIGEYEVVGKNPNVKKMQREMRWGKKESAGKPDYKGTLRITKPTMNYFLVWTLYTKDTGKPNIKMEGTGVLVNNILSVVFQNPAGESYREWYGIVSYEMVRPGVLHGKFAGWGRDEYGTEECMKIGK